MHAEEGRETPWAGHQANTQISRETHSHGLQELVVQGILLKSPVAQRRVKNQNKRKRSSTSWSTAHSTNDL